MRTESSQDTTRLPERPDPSGSVTFPTHQELPGQRLESLSVLSGGIAQDFSNLLVGILAHTGLAQKALSSGSAGSGRTARENLEQIEKAALEAAELARKLLAFSGKTKLATRALDLATLLHELRPLLRRAVGDDVELELNLTSQLPLIEADPGQIRQLLIHLLQNAADAVHAPHRAGAQAARISVGTGIVELEASEGDRLLPEGLGPGRYIYVTVSDNGHGMNEDTRRKIFDPFFSTKSRGQGLGLAAVLGIMHGHRGALKVESETGKGSTFQAYFPCVPHKKAAALPAVTKPLEAPSLATILVVDDDNTVRRVTGKLLEAAGYGVLAAADGVEALERLRDRGDAIDLVILDMRMPRMGGAEVFREIRRQRPGLPILISSGYDPQGQVAKLVEQGPTIFLHKPYSPQDLITKVGLLLDTTL